MQDVIIQYKGFFDYSLLNKILMDFKRFVDENNVGIYVFKKIQIAMVEMIENNYQYTQNIEKELISISNLEPQFKIQKFDQGFKILASNPILKSDVEELKEHIDSINDSSMSDLKQNYKEILKNGMFSEKKTAGTGLIRIAKITKNKIGYSFQEINNKLLYYTLEITVNPK